MAKHSATDVIRKALLGLGLELPDLTFVQRDSLYVVDQSVRIHEVDRTPVFLDPDLGPGDGVKAQCFVRRGLDVGGRARTGDVGRLTWKLSDFVCDGQSVAEPASFVATAQSDSAVVLTTKTVSTGDDLVIEVFSWDINGNPAPNVRFAWRCWTQTPPIID